MLISTLNDIMLAAKTTKVLCATVDVPESMLSNMGSLQEKKSRLGA